MCCVFFSLHDIFLNLHFTHDHIVGTGWASFVPLTSVNLSLLSIQMIQLYSNVVQQKEATLKYKRLVWGALSMCALATILNWIGSILGVFHDIDTKEHSTAITGGGVGSIIQLKQLNLPGSMRSLTKSLLSDPGIVDSLNTNTNMSNINENYCTDVNNLSNYNKQIHPRLYNNWKCIVCIDQGYQALMQHLGSEFSMENLLFVHEVC